MKTAVSKNEITLYFYPSPGLRWSSPAALSLTTALNKLTGRSRAIGHVSIRARSVEGEPIDILTGMTQLHPKEGRKEVLFKGYGLGILFHDFKGALEEASRLEPELVERAGKEGQLSYLRFETTREAVERVAQFLKAYRDRGAHQFYGLPHRPLYCEGGGCSAFAASVLEVAGLLKEEFRREWTRNYRLPLSHIGGPKTGKYVGMWKMLTRMSWAQADEPHEELFFWDPDLMHEWAVKKYQSESRAPTGQYRLEKWRSAMGLVEDATALQVPTNELFKGEPSEYFRRLRQTPV